MPARRQHRGQAAHMAEEGGQIDVLAAGIGQRTLQVANGKRVQEWRGNDGRSGRHAWRRLGGRLTRSGRRESLAWPPPRPLASRARRPCDRGARHAHRGDTEQLSGGSRCRR
ncbi:hypothetical protein ACFOPN_02045 [Xanthomonas hyacinthi]|uniref:hypothetical protein n=1 Tax=Xanthomonas hyacinthi TaxID=56455 RepID=UPI003606AF15